MSDTRLKGHFLHQLRPVRIARDITRPILERVTGLDEARIHDIEKGTHEPYLDEAVLIQRALGVPGILPLISSGDLTLSDLDLGVPLPTDVDMLRAGVRLPLSLAGRVALRVGLVDPSMLIATEANREVWHVLTTLRLSTCPWCRTSLVGDAAHEPDCLPDILWGSRGGSVLDLGATPRPVTPGKGRRASAKAKGLLVQLILARIDHKKVAEAAGIRPDYFSKIVNCRHALTVEKAEAISNVLRCDVALLYAPPTAEARKDAGLTLEAVQ